MLGVTVSLCCEKIEELSDLRLPTVATRMDVSINQIFDLQELSKFEKLEYLDISDNPAADLSPLYILKKLQVLRVSKSQFKNEQLEELKKINQKIKIELV